ncbi:hypothetical protein [Sphingomonas oligoaromativorans]|uniref:hypothetical protein n=1 Tax=Sphingomonas oligoaromativorans TaxID=575322 RepID=UPI001421EF49|nr:hypothetical protein [Sphingomonas oligoaromativorans]NIJ34314.1 hypothetical protein [Sphingomonas oligoaromativorans]
MIVTTLFERMSASARGAADPQMPHDLDAATWRRIDDRRFDRADGAEIYAIGGGQWRATYPDAGGARHVLTQRGGQRQFPSPGAAGRYLALHHPCNREKK